MDGFVLDLFLGSAHKVADSSLGIFSPIGLDVSNLHGQEFSVESVKERHQEVLFALNPEVVVCIVESPSVGSGLSEHEEIFGTCDKA